MSKEQPRSNQSALAILVGGGIAGFVAGGLAARMHLTDHAADASEPKPVATTAPAPVPPPHGRHRARVVVWVVVAAGFATGVLSACLGPDVRADKVPEFSDLLPWNLPIVLATAIAVVVAVAALAPHTDDVDQRKAFELATGVAKPVIVAFSAAAVLGMISGWAFMIAVHGDLTSRVPVVVFSTVAATAAALGVSIVAARRWPDAARSAQQRLEGR